MMKKQYFTPEIEVIEITSEQMLCLSTLIDGDADTPAGAPEWFDDENWDAEY